jgi:hypothetical protein
MAYYYYYYYYYYINSHAFSFSVRVIFKFRFIAMLLLDTVKLFHTEVLRPFLYGSRAFYWVQAALSVS